MEEAKWMLTVHRFRKSIDLSRRYSGRERGLNGDLPRRTSGLSIVEWEMRYACWCMSHSLIDW